MSVFPLYQGMLADAVHDAVTTPGNEQDKIKAAIQAAKNYAPADPNAQATLDAVIKAAEQTASNASASLAAVVTSGLNALNPKPAAADLAGVSAAINAALATNDLGKIQEAVQDLTDGTWTGLQPFSWDASFNSNMYNYSTSGQVFDQSGQEHKLTNYFVRAGDSGEAGRTWYVYTVIDDQYLVPADNSNPGGATIKPPSGDNYAQVLQFDPDGTMKSGITSRFALDLSKCKDRNTGNTIDLTSDNGKNWFDQLSNGGGYAFNLDLGKTTMFGVQYNQDSLHQDGYPPGTLSQVTVSEEGMIQASYSNGQVKVLGQLALSEFKNPNGLQSVGDNMWVETYASGQPTTGVPGSGTRGKTQGGAIEESKTDLTNELVQMIIMQRNYQANAQTIKTEDQILQTLVNLR
jgi:flagellar hook protein FlgE